MASKRLKRVAGPQKPKYFGGGRKPGYDWFDEGSGEEEDSEVTMSSGYVDIAPADLDMSSNVGYVDHYFSPRMTYHDGKTYLTFQRAYLDGVIPYGQARMIVFDKDKGLDRPFTVGLIPTSADSHNQPVVIADTVADKVYVTQEHVHDTPLRVYRSDTNFDCGSFTHAFSFGTQLSYPNPLQKQDGNWIMWSRGIAQPNANYYSMHLTKASSGFESWAPEIRITSRPTGQDPFLRHYPDVTFGHTRSNGFFHLLTHCRKDDGSLTGLVWFYRYYLLKTPDDGVDCGDLFYNETETFSHRISVDGILTDAILATNFSYHSTANDTTTGFHVCAGTGPNGKTYRIVGNGTLTGWSFIYYDGTTKVVKPVPISDTWPTPAGGTSGSGSTGAFNHMMVFSDNHIEVHVIKAEAFLRPYLYKTTDQGDTWENLGDMCPEVNDRHLAVLIPNNIMDIPADSNFPVFFAYNAGVSGKNGAIVKVAALGSIQPMADTVVGAEPPTTNGLYHYKCEDGKLTRSGNNVTLLIDQFGGLRSAACTNNPQWNGSNLVTFLSASLHKFAPASPSTLINKTALTFFCVLQNSPGITQYLLSFTHTADDTSLFSFNIDTAGVPYIYHDRGFSFNPVIMAGQDSISGGSLHLVVMVMDGQKRTDIYVDGKLQFLQISGASTLTEWEAVGQGPSLLGSKNIVTGAALNRLTDSYSDLILAEQRLYSGAMRLSDLRPAMKKICDDHGITFQSQFSVPT